MKKGWRNIAFLVIAAVVTALAFATCTTDVDPLESGDCAAGTAEHTWDNGKITTAATENDDGEKIFTCKKCGERKTEVIPASGHKHTIAREWTADEKFHWHEASCGKEAHRADKAAHKWDEGKTTNPATENDDGEKRFACTICGDTKTEAIPALGHEHTVASEWTADEAHHWHEASCGREEHRADRTAHEWDEGKTIKPATENDDGETLFTCTTCGGTKTEAVPALGHEHTAASEWTSDEKLHWHEASCGREEHRTDKTAHDWDSGTVTTAPTCIATGETTYTCTTCGKTRTEAIAITEHEWDNGTITKPATETETGEKTFICTPCGKKRTEVIPALGHEHTMASEWTSDEAHHWHEASCSREEHRADKATHEWNEGETTKPATENDDGEKNFVCTVCGKTKTETIPALGHEHIMASEWTTDEQFHWHEASCGREEHRTDKTAHEWDDGTVTTAPTCFTTGEMTYTCTTCGKTRTEAIVMIEHEWDNGTITKPATETETGEKAFTCTVCGAIRREVIPMRGHEHTLASEWTADEEYHWHDASCGREEHRTGKTAHNWDSGKVTTAPTCTATGETTYTCTTCGKTRTEAIAMTEHRYSTTWKSDASGHWNGCIGCEKKENFAEHATMTVTLTSDGERKETCPTCGYGDAPSAWTKETLSELFNAFQKYKEENVKIKVVGELSDTNAISRVLSNGIFNKRPSQLVALDLSETTGLTTISFKECNKLASILLPDGVTEIEDEAFSWCQYLTSITIPNSVTKIGERAFYNCDRLTSITIPNSMTEIGSSAFYSCCGLESVAIPASVTEIGKRAFYSCYRLTSIAIPDSVTKIGEHAFSGCSSLTSITIPNSVTEIGDYAFDDCKKLTSITIPNSVTKIGTYVFSSCKSLTSIAIPNTVTEIGERAFNWCSGLTNITIPNSVTKIGTYAFSCCENLISITIPNSVTEIGERAFNGCESLTSIAIPNSVTKIGEYVFSRCTSLTRVTFPNGITEIVDGMFSQCDSFTNITIPETVTKIGRSAFSYCFFTSISIPGNVTEIGERAFKDCSNLTDITIPNSVTKTGNNAFEGCSNLTNIIISNNMTEISEATFLNCSKLSSITIPNSVTKIGVSAFSYCTSLKSVGLPSTITEIGEAAFAYSGIESIEFPKSLTKIAAEAFRECPIQNIKIPASVTLIGYQAFKSCNSLSAVEFEDTSNWWVGGYYINTEVSWRNAACLKSTYSQDSYGVYWTSDLYKK